VTAALAPSDVGFSRPRTVMNRPSAEHSMICPNRERAERLVNAGAGSDPVDPARASAGRSELRVTPQR